MDLDDLKPSVCKHDRLGYIYHIIFKHPLDGRSFHYIGQHKSPVLDRRYFGSGKRLNAMYKKYGRCGGLFLVSWHRNQKDLDRAEIACIREARRLWERSCLNLNYGGETPGRHTPEVRKRISEANKGKVISKNHRASISRHWNSLSQEKRDRLNLQRSKKLKGRKKPPSHRAKISASLMGHGVSAETRAKIATAQRGRVWTPEQRAAASAQRRGKKRPIIVCPHCDTSGGSSNMKRWHFDNCRYL